MHNSKKKITLIVGSMESGGAERVAANLVNAWSERGDDVTLVITYSGKGECFYKISDKVRIIFLADLAKTVQKNVLGYAIRFYTLRKILRQLNPDIIISFLTHVNIMTIVATVMLPFPVIISEHTYPPLAPRTRSIELLRKWTYPFANKTIMLTLEGVDWLKKTIPSAIPYLIPNPVTFPIFPSNPYVNIDAYLTRSDLLILGVGRLIEIKQFDHLISAFAKLATKYPEWRMVILGEGKDRAILQRLITNHELSNRIFLVGNTGNVAEWYQRADIYALTSKLEGFPNTLIEAMAYGCACVSYDCDTGPRDIITHNEDGLLVAPAGDLKQFTSALEQLMLDQAKRLEFAKKAERIRETYSIENIINCWDKVFSEVSSKK